MSNLSKETIDKIKADSLKYLSSLYTGEYVKERYENGPTVPYEWERLRTTHEAGATEYAIKLHEAGHEIKGLKGDIEVRDWDIKKYNKEIKAARTLLEKFISRHEAGLLPDMFIYKEIKTFLDGTK